MQVHNRSVYFRMVVFGMIVGNKVAGKVIENLDNVAIYFDLVYNQNSSSSQRGRHLGKKATHFVGNREKT